MGGGSTLSLELQPSFLSSFQNYIHEATKATISLYVKLINNYFTHLMCRDGVFGIATGYELDDRGIGVRVPIGSRIFSSPRRPNRLWGQPNLLSNG
jgi:hypothetical protein